MAEIRASGIEAGQTLCEYGMDPYTVRAVRRFGDAVLIDTTEDDEIVLDCDEVVELVST